MDVTGAKNSTLSVQSPRINSIQNILASFVSHDLASKIISFIVIVSISISLPDIQYRSLNRFTFNS